MQTYRGKTMAGVKKAKALYAYEKDIPHGLSFEAEEILTILKQDDGKGWWEARNANGQQGLVPGSYFEMISSPTSKSPRNGKTVSPPPPPPPVSRKQSISSTSLSSSTGKAAFSPPPPPPRQTIIFNDDEYCNSAMLKNPSSSTSSNHHNNDIDEDYDDCDEWEDDDESLSSMSQDAVSSEFKRGRTPSEASIGSEELHFRRSGAAAFLFSSFTDPEPTGGKTTAIVSNAEGFIWKPLSENYTCSITSPKKESKFGGMKTFITYQLTPTFSNIQVSRRYKQFCWLHQRLTEKFTTISIPPLPERPQLVGKFEDDFVSHRLRLLQLWVTRMCKHPVISHTDVFLHFLTCTDDKKWTKGKRVAEKDEIVGGRWFNTVQTPPLNSQQSEVQVEKFSRFVKNMDEGLRQMISAGEHNLKKHEAFRKEYQKLGNSYTLMAKSFKLDERPASLKMIHAMEQTGRTYDEIGTSFGNQPLLDMADLLEGLQEYRGILSTFPSAISIHMESINNVKEKMEKLSDSEKKSVQRRADVITATVLANMLYFQQERIADFKQYMCHYLEKQIEFHTQIASKLKENLQEFKKI